MTFADTYGIMRNITGQHSTGVTDSTLTRKGDKMNYMKTQMKSDLWDIVYKAQEDEVSWEVTKAIIDVMILMDKEQEKKLEKTEDCS